MNFKKKGAIVITSIVLAFSVIISIFDLKPFEKKAVAADKNVIKGVERVEKSKTKTGESIEKNTLKDAYKDYFKIGTIAKTIPLESGNVLELTKKHFNFITPENAMKPDELHPKEDQFIFDKADNLVTFAQSNGMEIDGHTLIWHNQTPDWFFKDENGNQVSREVLLKRMETHIKTIVGHYKGKIRMWDVVNEAVNDGVSNNDTSNPDKYLRDSNWKKIIGNDYIEYAFRFAHEADPDAELYYNDYNETSATKRDCIADMVKRLLDKGVPINGIGLQSHYDMPKNDAEIDKSVANIKATLDKFTSLGVKVSVTELDMNVTKDDKYANGLPEDIAQLQAKAYGAWFNLYKQYKGKIERVSFWGVYDGGSWLNSFQGKRTNYPLLFDRNFNPKPAYYSVIKQVQ